MSFYHSLLMAKSGGPTTTTTTIAPVQASNLIFSNVTDASLTLSWTRGNGSNVLIVGKKGSAVDSFPVNGSTYSANDIFGLGDEIGTGNFVLYKGTGTSVNISFLDYNSTYHFRAFEFTGTTYLTGTATSNPNSQLTNTYSAAETAIFRKSATSYFFEVNGSGNYANSSPSQFVTLSGSSGTANINIGSVNYLCTFTTNLKTSIDNFKTTHGATLAALGYVITTQGFATAGGLTVIDTSGVNPAVSITNVSGNLTGTIANGAVSNATKPDVVSGLVTFDGTKYFNQPLTETLTSIIVANVPNTASGMVVRGINQANQSGQVSVTGTGAFGNVSDYRINDRIEELTNNSKFDVGSWVVGTYTFNAALSRGAVYYGATNTGTLILDSGSYAAIISFNFVLTEREFQDAYNYVMKRIATKGLGLSTIMIPKAINSVITNAPNKLDLPQVYGADQSEWNQNIHPKVLDMENYLGVGETWAGYRYWMANTPFPYLAPNYDGVDLYENPCIYVSNDGTNWINPPGVTNPLFPNAGNNGYNSDVHIEFDTDTMTMHYYWRELNSNADEQYHCHTSSTDGFVTYTAKLVMFTKYNVVADGANNYLSPVIFKDPYTGKWVMYGNRFLNAALVNPRQNVFSREISDTPTGFVGNFVDCDMPKWYPISTNSSPWHMDIIPDSRINNGNGRGYVALPSISTTGASQGQLHGTFLTSVDGLKWYGTRIEALVNPTVPPATYWDGSRIYRPSIYPNATGYEVYYSAIGFPYVNVDKTPCGTGHSTAVL